MSDESVDFPEKAKEFVRSLTNDDIEQALKRIDEEDVSRRMDRSFPACLVSARPAPGGAGRIAWFTASDGLHDPDLNGEPTRYDFHDPMWELSGEVVQQGDRLALAELTIRLHPQEAELPQGGIKRQVLNAIKIPEILRGVRQSLVEHARRVGIDFKVGRVEEAYADHADRVASAVSNLDADPVPGRRGHDVLLYQHLAHTYLAVEVKMQEEGQKTARGIIDRLTKELWPVDRERGLVELPRDTVKSRLRKCADLELLTFEGSGRAGAVAGPRLLEDLDEGRTE